jgi:hypothetical protein
MEMPMLGVLRRRTAKTPLLLETTRRTTVRLLDLV